MKKKTLKLKTKWLAKRVTCHLKKIKKIFLIKG